MVSKNFWYISALSYRVYLSPQEVFPMDYRDEIIKLLYAITDNRVLAFFYGLFYELVKHVKTLDDITIN